MFTDKFTDESDDTDGSTHASEETDNKPQDVTAEPAPAATIQRELIAAEAAETLLWVEDIVTETDAQAAKGPEAALPPVKGEERSTENTSLASQAVHRAGVSEAADQVPPPQVADAGDGQPPKDGAQTAREDGEEEPPQPSKHVAVAEKIEDCHYALLPENSPGGPVDNEMPTASEMILGEVWTEDLSDPTQDVIVDARYQGPEWRKIEVRLVVCDPSVESAFEIAKAMEGVGQAVFIDDSFTDEAERTKCEIAYSMATAGPGRQGPPPLQSQLRPILAEAAVEDDNPIAAVAYCLRKTSTGVNFFGTRDRFIDDDFEDGEDFDDSLDDVDETEEDIPDYVVAASYDKAVAKRAEAVAETAIMNLVSLDEAREAVSESLSRNAEHDQATEAIVRHQFGLFLSHVTVQRDLHHGTDKMAIVLSPDQAALFTDKEYLIPVDPETSRANKDKIQAAQSPARKARDAIRSGDEQTASEQLDRDLIVRYATNIASTEQAKAIEDEQSPEQQRGLPSPQHLIGRVVRWGARSDPVEIAAANARQRMEQRRTRLRIQHAVGQLDNTQVAQYMTRLEADLASKEEERAARVRATLETLL